MTQSLQPTHEASEPYSDDDIKPKSANSEGEITEPNSTQVSRATIKSLLSLPPDSDIDIPEQFESW